MATAALLSTEPGRGPGACRIGQLVKPSSRDLFRRELPWLVAEVVLLVVITNANPPGLWFGLVLLLVILGYRIERFLVGGEGTWQRICGPPPTTPRLYLSS